ncbi:DUF4400 domain-containing protein [Cupriavidus numazuensis]|uniref:DUF4400 domain-containing protein n=1 Tax=Cupriavidus numazuensis TaxID=221992 RepID=A0ABM8TND6_9BURK|nr:DUF4400 domain-containing protein [Cupriavidus numazuensis]CAG2155393.1 hypothetical protein LMG26411_04924 [Cupriavidus numazuensis]
MANSRFGAHVRLWLLAAPLMICALAPLIADDAAFEVGEAEQTSVIRLLGDKKADAATQAANEHFARWFVQPGVIKASFAGSAERAAISDAGASDMGRRWMAHFWLMMYRMLYRAAVGHYWLFGAVVLLAALLNDGSVSRRIKASAAGFANPVSFHVAAHGLLVSFGVGASALLLPVPLLAYWWTAGVCFVGLLSWRLAASFHVGR